MKSLPRKLCGVFLLVCGIGLLIAGFHQMLARAEYRATARIKVARSVRPPTPPTSFHSDPYFIQTEFEVIQSEAVLIPVIERLNLNEAWRQRYGTPANLKTHETIGLLKRNLGLRPVRSTYLIEIEFTSPDADEAATVANTVVDVYLDYRRDQIFAQRTSRIQTHGQRWRDFEQQLLDSQIEVARLRKHLDILDEHAAATAEISAPYFEAKRQCEELKMSRKKRVKEFLAEIETPVGHLPELVAAALSPTRPFYPYRKHGAVMAMMGLLSSLAGIVLLRYPS